MRQVMIRSCKEVIDPASVLTFSLRFILSLLQVDANGFESCGADVLQRMRDRRVTPAEVATLILDRFQFLSRRLNEYFGVREKDTQRRQAVSMHVRRLARFENQPFDPNAIVVQHY